MNIDASKIYIDRLKDGRIEKIAVSLPSVFLGIEEKELVFSKEAFVLGKAYLVEDNLVLRLSVRIEGMLPCLMCNEMSSFEVSIKERYFVQRLQDIKMSVFDFKKILREALLLEVPSTLECCGGSCPKRKRMLKYLKEKGEEGVCSKDFAYYPFNDLDF